MEMRLGVKYLVKISLFLVFLYLCHKSVIKYQTGRKSTETRMRDIDKVLYPSVSVCVDYGFKHVIDNQVSGNFSVNQTESLIRKYVWVRNETFYFVNHPTIESEGYPCITTQQSVDPRRPCTFPFNYLYESKKTLTIRPEEENTMKTFYNCDEDFFGNDPWCLTKVNKNRTKGRVKKNSGSFH